MAGIYARMFSGESDPNLDPPTSLIDKILELGKTQDPISLTAQIIRERTENKANILKSLNGDDKDDASEGDGDGKEDNAKEETPAADAGGKDEADSGEEGGEDNDEAAGDGEKAEEGGEDKPAEPTPPPAETKPAQAEGKSKADGEDSHSDFQHIDSSKDVEGLIGSGLKEGGGGATPPPAAKEPAATDKPAAKDPTPAKESFAEQGVLFTNLKLAYEQYVGDVKEMNPNAVPNTPDERPVAYVAKDITLALSNMVNVSAKYIEYTDKLSGRITNLAKEANNVVGTYKTYLSENRIKYTYKLLKDTDLLSKIGIEGSTDIRVTSKALHVFNEESAKLILHVLNNDFSALASAITASGFSKTPKNIDIEKIHEFQYRGKIPGFYRINATLQDYTSYLNADTKAYGFFKSNGAPQQVLLDLPAISVTKDKDLSVILQSVDTVLVEVVALCDNIGTVKNSVQRFIELVKVKIFDINNGNAKQLSALKIDETIQHFIQLKMAIELMTVTSEVNLAFLSGVISAIPELANAESETVSDK